MITVRFATGLSIQYNNATYVLRRDTFSDLLTKKDGTMVAQVPNDALIELMPPCSVYDARFDTGRLADDFLKLLRDPERRATVYGYTMRDIGRVLREFDLRKKRWKK